MDVRIEVVGPLEGAEAASAILRAAWRPPCLHYTSSYLHWQFGFPGPPKAEIAIASIDGAPVGCIGVTPRRFLRDKPVVGYVLSFVAVDPTARGRGIAAAMYRALLEKISSTYPIVAFAEPNSQGERLLIGEFDRAQYRHRSFGPCRAAGYIPNAIHSNIASSCIATPTSDYDEFSAALAAADKNGTIWNAPTAEQWRHYKTDPRRRFMIVIRNGSNVLSGCAMVVFAEVLTLQGIQHVPMLENVCVPIQPAEGLRAAFAFAAEQAATKTTIVASNIGHLETTVIKASGARGLPPSFNAHAFVGTDQLFDDAQFLSLEVV